MSENNISIQKQIDKYISQMIDYNKKSKSVFEANEQNTLEPNILSDHIYSGNDLEFSNNEDAENQYKKFKKENPRKGYIQVKTLTVRRTYPVEGAKVTVYITFDDKQKYIITSTSADSSGLTPLIALPATKKEEADNPNSINPYTSYTVVVEHPDFLPMYFYNVPVFENIISTQTAEMILKSAAAPGQTKIEVYEREPANL
ncbi:MAG: hypothetical protein RSC30_07395 [Oscillospiraceae bacterium]